MLSNEPGKYIRKYVTDYVVANVVFISEITENAEIIRISAIKVKGEKIVKEFDSFVKPSIPISDLTNRQTGITNSMVEKSPSINDVFADFLEFIEDDVMVFNHNVSIFYALNDVAKMLYGMVLGNAYTEVYISKVRISKSAKAIYYGNNFGPLMCPLERCRVVKRIYESLFHRFRDNDNGIVELHCHTKMSEGLVSAGELVECAYDKGYRAIAITDCGNVQAFPEAYLAWQNMWVEYEDECRQIGEKADKNSFLKVIYGLEGNLIEEDGNVYPILLYAKNDAGIKNLYKIVTASNLEYYDKIPLIPRKYLEEHMDGIIVASIREDDEVFAVFNIDDYYELSNEECIIKNDVLKKRALISDQIEHVNPLRMGKYYPEYPNADEELTKICTEKVRKLFGDEPDYEVEIRLERELNAIKENGYAGIYMMCRQLVSKSLEAGYPTGIIGAAGSSFVAYLCGITDINPLSKNNSGYQIEEEVFMGLHLDRQPDFAINFAYSIRDLIQEYVGEFPGVGEICYAGTISTISATYAKKRIERDYKDKGLPIPKGKDMDLLIEKNVGVKTGHGVYTGAIFVCPEGEELLSFTPLTHSDYGEYITTEFDYHVVEHNLMKLVILGRYEYDVLHILQEKTGIRLQDIPLDDDNVLKMICDVERDEIKNLPEFGNKYTRSIIKVARPETFDDLIKISALSHGKYIWEGNQKELIESGQIDLMDCISSRDDIMHELLIRISCSRDIAYEIAYEIMESVGNGNGLKHNHKRIMRRADIPEWYIEVCKKISYLFPKSHAVSYAMLAVRLAYYMVYYPDEYYEALSEVV